MTERRKAAALRVERAQVEEDVRDGLHVRLPVFVFDVEPRPDLAMLIRQGGSIGFAETPWTVQVRQGERCAVLAVTPLQAGAKPFAVAFPLTTYGPLLEVALQAGELGLRPNTITALPPPLNRLTVWVRGTNDMLRELLEAEN